MISMDKRYRTRSGRKARVICVDAKCAQPVFALIEEPNGSDTLRSYSEEGLWFPDQTSYLDLIEIPELEFDWSCLPKWANWITRDKSDPCNVWFWWSDKPILGANGLYARAQARGTYSEIPAAYAPRYHGSDPAPIFQRPTEEGE